MTTQTRAPEQHSQARPETTMRATVEWIGPPEARKYLAENYANRNLMTPYVQQLTGAMERGEWVENGEPVQFDLKGNLINGQHTLNAIVASGYGGWFVVVRGLAVQKAQETVDMGRIRKLRDHLKIRGVRDATSIAAAINFLWRYQNGKMKRGGGSKFPTAQQGLALWEANPQIQQHVPLGHRLNRELKMAPAVAVCFSYIFARIDDDDAEDFFEKLQTGHGIGEGYEVPDNDPIGRYRRWLINQMGKPYVERYSREHAAALLVKAWNAYRDGIGLETLTWTPGGKRNEPFPTPH